MGRTQHGNWAAIRKSLVTPVSSPRSIFGSRLVLDLDSDYGLPAPGQLVSSWVDQSGRGNTPVQATPSLQPVVVANVLSGHSAVRFDGARWLDSAGFTGVVAGDFPRMYVIASFTGDISTFDGSLVVLRYATVSSMGLSAISQNIYVQEYRNSALKSGGAQPTGASFARGLSSNPGLFDVRNDPTSLTLRWQDWTDGVNFVVTATGLDYTPVSVVVGANGTYTGKLSGDIFRVIVVNGPPPTAAEHIALILYLKRMYRTLWLPDNSVKSTPLASPTLAQINGSNLILDLNSDVGLTMGTGVASWADSSGQNNAAPAQATGSKQPTVVANALDNHQALQFTRANSQTLGMVSGLTGIPAGSKPRIYVVGNFDVNNANQTMVETTDTDGSVNRGIWLDDESAVAIYYRNALGATPTLRDATMLPVTVPLLWDGQINVTNQIELSANGVSQTLNPSATAEGLKGDQIQIGIGAQAHVGNYLQGKVYRVAIVNPPPSALQHQQNLDYFRRQYPALAMGTTVAEILGPLLTEQWDCRNNCTVVGGLVTQWVGMKRGIAVAPYSGTYKPVFGVDGANFNGLSVVHTASVGPAALQNAAIPWPPLQAMGTRPYVLVVARVKSHGLITSGNRFLVDIRTSGGTAFNFYSISGGWMATSGGPGAAYADTKGQWADTRPHVFGFGYNSAGLQQITIDGQLASIATVAAVTTEEFNHIRFGSLNGVLGGDNAIAAVICMSAIPSAAQLAAVHAKLFADFGIVTYQSILGSLLVESWHCQGPITVTGTAGYNWTGQMLGTVLPAPAVGQRPIYGPNGTMFGGKSVVQTQITSTKVLRAFGLATALLPVGGRPWAYFVGRVRDTTASVVIADYGVSGTSDDGDIRVNASGAIEAYNAAVMATGVAADNARHSFQHYLDGTNLNLSIDNGAPAVVPATGTNAHAITAVGIGVTASTAGSQPGNVDAALYLLCSSKPSPAQIAAVEALAALEFPGGDSPYMRVLGSLLVEMWHSQIGVGLVSGQVNTWTGAIGGRVLTAPSSLRRPLYQANAAFSSGLNMVETVAASTSCLAGTGLTQLFATATRPYIISVVRMTLANGAIQMFVEVTDGVGGAKPFLFTNAANTLLSSSSSSLAFSDTSAAHTFETGSVAAGGGTDYTGVDGVYGTATGVPALAAASTGVYMGSNTGSVQYANASHALHLLCSAQPTAAQIAAVTALAKAEFGY